MVLGVVVLYDECEGPTDMQSPEGLAELPGIGLGGWSSGTFGYGGGRGWGSASLGHWGTWGNNANLIINLTFNSVKEDLTVSL